MNVHASVVTAKPPFRAEHIGSLLRPAELMAERARFARGEIDAGSADRGGRQGHLRRHRVAGATRLQIRHRRRIPPPLLSQLLLSPARRPLDRHDRRRRGEGRRRRQRRARCAADGRDRQPRAMDASDQWRRRVLPQSQFGPRAEDHDPRSLRAALPRRQCRGAGERLQRHGSVLVGHGGGLHQGAARARRRRLPLRADRRNGVCQIRRSRRAGDARRARRRLEPTDRHAISPSPTASCARRPRNCTSACICAAAIAAAIGIPKAVTKRSRTGCSTRSKSRSIFSNTTYRERAILRRCALCRNHKSVVLGLVSTKVPELEDKAALRRRLDDATKFVAVDRLAVSPQCGFASIDTGNPVTPEAQRRKLELVCDLAREIWGET